MHANVPEGLWVDCGVPECRKVGVRNWLTNAGGGVGMGSMDKTKAHSANNFHTKLIP